jgi:hypothetical protein
MQGTLRATNGVNDLSNGARQADMAWQGAGLQGRAHTASLTPRLSGQVSQQQTGEEGEEEGNDSDDMQTEKRSQQPKDRPRKPHLQGRFSGRLETKARAQHLCRTLLESNSSCFRLLSVSMQG